MYIQSFRIVPHTLTIGLYQTQPQPTKSSHKLLIHPPIQPMIQQHYLMLLLILRPPHQYIPRMRITMYEFVFEYHLGEYLDQVLGTCDRVDTHGSDTLAVVYLSTLDELHGYDTL